MTRKHKLNIIGGGLLVLVPLVTWGWWSGSYAPANVLVDSTHTFDGNHRVTDVARDNGHSIHYDYDASGNIVGVTSVGRSSATVNGVLDLEESHHDFEFCGTAGEPITVRLEAVPREAGIGKFAKIRLEGKTVLAALPTELTMVLPETDDYEIRVEDPEDTSQSDDGSTLPHRYVGPFTLTLEASAATVATFMCDCDDDTDDAEDAPYESEPSSP